VLAADAGQRDRHVLVRGCRFEGPYQTAVQLAGSVEDVHFTQNRFFKGTDAFLCTKANPPHALELDVSANTFYDFARGLHWETLPSAEHPDHLIVRGNLFLKTRRLGWVDGIDIEPAEVPAHWIWFDEPRTSTGGMPAATRYFRKSFIISGPAPMRAGLDVACDDACTVWLNGTQVGQTPGQHYTKHVYHFDVTTQLRSGPNVLAVQASNLADFMTNAPTDARLLVQLSAGPQVEQQASLVVTDATWKSAANVRADWQAAGFDDSGWTPVRVFDRYNGQSNGPWVRLPWDSVIQRQLPGRASPILLTAKGNVRDYASAEGYPALEAHGGNLNLPTQPGDDAQFLRYPRTSPLVKVGSPGVPPE
jgi:hypothetical protein